MADDEPIQQTMSPANDFPQPNYILKESVDPITTLEILFRIMAKEQDKTETRKLIKDFLTLYYERNR